MEGPGPDTDIDPYPCFLVLVKKRELVTLRRSIPVQAEPVAPQYHLPVFRGDKAREGQADDLVKGITAEQHKRRIGKDQVAVLRNEHHVRGMLDQGPVFLLALGNQFPGRVEFGELCLQCFLRCGQLPVCGAEVLFRLLCGSDIEFYPVPYRPAVSELPGCGTDEYPPFRT